MGGADEPPRAPGHRITAPRRLPAKPTRPSTDHPKHPRSPPGRISIDAFSVRGLTFAPAREIQHGRGAMTTQAVQLTLYRWGRAVGTVQGQHPLRRMLAHRGRHQRHPRERARRHPGRHRQQGVVDRVVEAAPQGRMACADRDGRGKGREPGSRPEPRRAHRGDHRRPRGPRRRIRQPPLRQGDLPALRAGRRGTSPKPASTTRTTTWSRTRARSTR